MMNLDPVESPEPLPYRLTETELATMQNRDRLLPSQPFLSTLFKGQQDEFFSCLEQTLLTVIPFHRVEDRWELELKPGVTYASLGSDLSTLRLYQLLLRLGGCRTVLELGTYIGVSTLFLAEAVGIEGRVTTVERGEEFWNLAQRNFRRNGYQDRIEAILGDALGVLRDHLAQGRTYDMVLVDACKEAYHEILPMALECLNPGGLLVVDDIFLNGDTLNLRPTTDKGLGVRAMLESAARLPADHGCVVLPLGNGMMLVRKP